MRFLILLVAVAAACAGDAPHDRPATVVHDSAGITIVENPDVSTANLPTWRLGDRPTVEIGKREGGGPAEQLSGVVGGAVLPDGRIVIADRGSRELRFFAPDGSSLLVVGGPGGGPGKLTNLVALDRIGPDTLVGGSWPVGMSAWFDAEGTFLWDTRIGLYGPGLAGHFLPDGSLLADTYEGRSYGNRIEWWAAYGTEAFFRPEGWLVRVSRDGEVVDTLRRLRGEEYFKTGRQRQGRWLRPLPYAHHTHVTWNDKRIFVGETERSEITVLRYDGTVERSIRWVDERPLVSSGDRSAFADSVMERVRPNRRADLARWLTAVSYPDTKPWFRDLQSDRAGRVWVRSWIRSARADDRWLVFDTTGQIVAIAMIPSDLTVLEIGGDYLLSVWKDELDVEFVRRYRLVM